MIHNHNLASDQNSEVLIGVISIRASYCKAFRGIKRAGSANKPLK